MATESIAIAADDSGHRQAVPLSLHGGYVWTLAGYVVYSAAQWATFVVLAKLGSDRMVGQYALGLAIATPLSLITNLSLRSLVVVSPEADRRFGHYLSLRLVGSLALVALAVGFCELIGYSAQATVIVAAVCLAQVVEGISDIYYGLMQRCERMDQIALSQIGRSLLGITVFAACLALKLSMPVALIGLLFARLLVLAAYDLPASRRLSDTSLSPRWDPPAQYAIGLAALPLGLVNAVVAFNGNLPRLVLERSRGEVELGVFSMVYYLPLAGSLLVAALGQAAFGRLARLFREGRLRELTLLVGKMILLAFTFAVCIVSGCAVLGSWALAVLYRPDLANHAGLLVGLAAAVSLTFISSVLGVALTAAGCFKPQLALSLVSTAAILVASLSLIPAWGLRGAMLSLFAGAAVTLVGSAVLSIRVLFQARALLPQRSEAQL
jgi:O-antigen/teichoic acid export membrane protein